MSQSRPKSRRREWTLSPRDLPDPRLIKDEPLLQDLENNAIYRMMIFRAANASTSAQLPIAKGCFVVFIFLLLTGTTGPATSLLFLLVVMIISAIRRISHSAQQDWLLGLDRSRLAEAAQAGVDAQTFIGAVWGRTLPELVHNDISRALYIACLFPLVMLFGFFSWGLCLIGAPILFLSAHRLSHERHHPYPILPKVLRIFSDATLRSQGAEARFFAGCGSAYFALMILGIVVLAFLSFQAISLSDRSDQSQRFLDSISAVVSSPMFVIAINLVSILWGAYLGHRKGLRQKLERDLWIATIRPYLNELISNATREPEPKS